MTSAVLDRRIGAYRCPECGVAYVRSASGLWAVSITPKRSLRREADGLFSCPCEAAQRFGWNS